MARALEEGDADTNADTNADADADADIAGTGRRRRRVRLVCIEEERLGLGIGDCVELHGATHRGSVSAPLTVLEVSERVRLGTVQNGSGEGERL